MSRRTFHAVAIGMLCGVLCCATAQAELNLWVSYYYQGQDNFRAGEYRDADTILQTAKAEYCRDESEAHRLASNLDTLGLNCMALQDYESSEKFLLCALSLKEQALGKESRWIPCTLNNLGDLYFVTGDPAKAEQEYRRSLKINESDQQNIEVCRGLNGMALIHNKRAEYVEAEELLKRAIDLHQRHQRRWHPYLATTLINLGALYVNQDRAAEAEPLLKQAELIQDKTVGESHPDVALRLSAQAAMYAKLGKVKRAARLEKRAEDMRAQFAEINKAPAEVKTAE